MEQILARMINRMVARTDLSDITDASTYKHELAAIARDIDEVYFQFTRLLDLFSVDTAKGDDLDARAKEIQPGTIRRVQASRAVGAVVFSRATNPATTVTIPSGTVVRTADGIAFRTTIQGQISGTSAEQIAGHGVGRDSSPVSVTADVAGAAGNVATATIVKFGSKIPGVDSVTNLAPTTQGRDKESDDDFVARIKAFVATLSKGTVEALEFFALGVEDAGKQVVFSHVFEDPIDLGKVTLYVDDGAGTASATTPVVAENLCFGLAGPPANSAVGGEEFLFSDRKPLRFESAITLSSSTRGALTLGTHYFVNPASGLFFFSPALVNGEVITASYTYYTGLIAAVQKVIDGDAADRTNFPGVKAAGTLVQVKAPTVIAFNVAAVLLVAEGTDQATAVAAGELAVLDYVNNLGISGDVVRNEIIERLMGVEGVTDVSLTLPAANVAVLDQEIPRITIANIDID
jgi:uncharacterized phage protein gp47/JayE